MQLESRKAEVVVVHFRFHSIRKAQTGERTNLSGGAVWGEQDLEVGPKSGS